MVERLARRSDVEAVRVLTTCALDHATWKNHYPPGRERVAGVDVERFPVLFPRLRRAQTLLGWGAHAGPRLRALEAPWVVAQGPFAPALLRGIDRLERDFDAFVFFTYLYYPTVYGLPRIRRRALLVAFTPGSIVSLSGYFSTDDRYNHVMAGIRSGVVVEVYWESGKPETLGKAELPETFFPGSIISVSSYYSSDPSYNHVLVAHSAGKIHEIYWKSGQIGIEGHDQL